MKRYVKHTAVSTYDYILPRDEKKAQDDAVVIGGMSALQDFRTITTEEIREKALTSYETSHKTVNDTSAYRKLFIRNFVVGYVFNCIRYLEDRSTYEKEKDFLEKYGYDRFLEKASSDAAKQQRV